MLFCLSIIRLPTFYMYTGCNMFCVFRVNCFNVCQIKNVAMSDLRVYDMSLVLRKPVFGVSRSHKNGSVQPQKMARGLKFWI